MTNSLKNKNPAGGRGFIEPQTLGNGLQRQCNYSPIELLLNLLRGVRYVGKGWVAMCPAHEETNASLSLAEGNDGRALLHCFAGCDPLSVVHALGLELQDLFPRRHSDLSREGRIEARAAWKQASWAAALGVLCREATVVLISMRMMAADIELSVEDNLRLDLAIVRIERAREVLT